jgi:DNA-binding MarR family transcriptional regulator
MSNSTIDFCLSFHLAYSKLRFDLDEELGTYHGISLDDFALLHSLASGGGTPTALQPLAAQLGTSRLILLRRLRPLEKIGLITCLGEISDRHVALRAPGHSLVQTAQDTIVRVCDKLSVAHNFSALLDGTRKPV